MDLKTWSTPPKSMTHVLQGSSNLKRTGGVLIRKSQNWRMFSKQKMFAGIKMDLKTWSTPPQSMTHDLQGSSNLKRTGGVLINLYILKFFFRVGNFNPQYLGQKFVNWTFQGEF